MEMNIIRNKMGKKAVAALMAVMIMSAPVTSVSFAAEEGTGEPIAPQTTSEQAVPEKPEATNHKDNSKIEEYNKKVDEHNAAEQQRVQAAEERNAQAQKAADEANQKIDEENAAEQARVNEHNSSEDEKAKASAEAKKAAEEENESIKAHNEAVAKYKEDKAQYDADYAQYQKDLAMEQKIKAAGYASVEQYNDMINTHYNEPAKASVEKNASAKTVSVKDTYTVAEAAEKSGVNVNVHIEHVFEGTNVSYIEDFGIDGNDVITINSIAALGNATAPGYASLYYNTDENHSMGYWVPTVELQYNAKYVNSTWNCGSSYEVSYKDGKNHKYDTEDIIAIYTYIWVPQRVYKTYNVPVAPTEPENPGEARDLVEVPELYVPEYKAYEEKQHVAAELEEISAAVLWEYISLFDVPETAEPAKAAAEPIETASPATANAVIVDDVMPLAAANTEVVSENAVPMTIMDSETPLAQTGAWALINLICAAATALLSLIMLAVYFGKRRNEDEQIEEENVSKMRIASLIPAIGAIIAFILTEDMSLPMAMVDKWTVLMITILAIQAGVGLFAKLRDNEEYEQEDGNRA